MIIVDPRVGSKPGGVHDLAQGLKARGLPVQTDSLAYGDVSWTGTGPQARPVLVGMEIKTVSDMMSCITSGRFAGHQLAGLQDAYEVAYLLVVGHWRAGLDGELQIPMAGGWITAPHGRQGGWKYSEAAHWLTTMEFRGGLHIRRAYNKAEVLALVHAEWSWWEKGMDHHQAHLDFDRSFMDRVSFIAPSPLRKMYAQLPGVGWERSAKIEDAFPTMKAAMGATDKEWLAVEGIGKGTLKKIKEVLG